MTERETWTKAEAIKLSGRSETWLRRHECSWCGQSLYFALTGGCGAIGEECDPSKKDFGVGARKPRERRANGEQGKP